MNKIYKVIWSKVRNCYIVVSELAKSHDSAHGTRSRSGCARKAAVLAAFVLTTSLAGTSVWAQTVTTDTQATNQNNAAASQAVNIEKKSEATAQGSDAYVTYDSEGNLIAGKNNEVVKIQTDTKAGYTRVENQPENVVMGTRNGVGTFTHATDTVKPVTDNTSYSYEDIDTKWITTKVYNPATKQYEEKQIKVYSLVPGQYMDDAHNVRAKSPERAYYSSDADYNKAVEVYNNVATYIGTDSTSKSYYVSGATAVGIDNIAEGTNSTALGNKAKVLNASSSYYVDGDGKLTSVEANARYWLDNQGNITTTRSGYYASDGTFVDRYLMVPRLTDSSNAVALGSDVLAVGRSAVAVGHDTHAKEYSVAIGEADNTDYSAVAVGNTNRAQYHSVAVGSKNAADGYYSLAQGDNNTVNGDYSNAVGYQNQVSGSKDTSGSERKAQQSQAYGANNTVKGNYSMAYGNSNTVTGDYAVAVGNQNKISGDNTTGADGERAIAIGYNNQAEEDTVTIGQSSQAHHPGSIAIGKNVNGNINNNNNATDSIAIGTESQAATKDSIAFGHGAVVGNNMDVATSKVGGNVAMGTDTFASAAYDVAIGTQAQTASSSSSNSGGSAVAIGYKATVNDGGQRSVALGANSSVALNMHDAVALGSQSRATRDKNNGGYNAAANGSNSYTDGTSTWNSTLAAVSVGADSYWDGSKTVEKQTRQITNVAAGKEDTDAVNVAQLKQVVNLVNNGGGSGTGGSGVHDYSVKSVDSANDSNYNNAGATGSNALAAGVNASATGAHSVAVGNGAQAVGQDSIALGTNAKAEGQGALVVGDHNSATGQNAVAFGGGYNKDEKGNTASATASLAFGENTVARAEGAVAFGYGTQAGSEQVDKNGKNYGQDAVAFGNGTKALGGRSLAFGERTLAEYTNAVAFGADTQSRSNGATAFGSRTRAMAQYSTAFGNRTIAAGNYATAFGTDTLAGVKTDASGAMWLTNGTKIDSNGNEAYTDTDGNTYAVKGFQNVKNGQPSGEIHDYVVVKGMDGNQYIQDYHGDIHAVTLTKQADGTVVATASTDILKNVTLQAAAPTSTAGYDFVDYDNATAFGESTKAINVNATALGKNSVASGENSLAFGEGSTAAGSNSVAGLGGTVAAEAVNAAAIGKDAQAKLADSVALGSGAVADRQSGAKGYDAATGQETTQTSATWVSSANAVAVGNGSTLTRQITGVAAGSQDTDAVNLAQLKEVGKLAGKHTTVSVGDQKATADDTLVKGGNLELKRKITDGQANYDVALSKDVVLGEQEEHKGGSLVVNSVAQFRTAPGSKDTYSVKEAVKIDGTTVSVVKNDGTNDQRQVVLGIGQDTGGYVALFDNTGNTPTYIFNAISSGITYLKDGNEYPADEANEFNRLEYGDITNGSTEFIATLDDGLKFGGDQGTTSAVKLNQKLTVTGGETNPDNLVTANNIGVVSSQDGDNGKLELKLNKDLTGLNTVTAGTAKIGHHADGVLDTVQNGQPTGGHAPDGNYVTGLTNKEWTVKAPTYVSGRAATEDELRIVSDAVSGNTTSITNNTTQITNNTNAINSGLSFTTNTKDAANTSENYKGYKVVKRNLGDTIAIKASDETGGHDYSTANLTTRIAENGDISILMDEKPTFTTVTTGDVIYTGNPDKKDNNDKAAQADTSVHYGDKTLTDGQNITTSDHETKSTRLGYKDAQDKRHDIATLDDGQIYAGDITSDGKLDEKGFARTMNQKTTINGGVKKTGKLTEGNIGVVSNGTDTLTVKLAKDLKDLTSVTTGKTVQNDSGITITNDANDETKNVVINGDKISFGGNQVTNMGSGINTATNQYDTLTNGANIGDVQEIANNTTEAAKLTGDSNITVTYNDQTADGKNTVKLNDSITLGSDADKKVTIDGTEGTITAGDKVSLDGSTGKGTIGGVIIGNQTGVTTTKKDGDKAKTEDGTFVTGLTNTTWNPDANGIVSGRAATEDQLKTVSDTVNAGWELDVNGTKQKAVTPTSPKVNFVQGQNITITGSGDDVTVATADSVRFDKVRVTSDKNASGGYTGGIVIGKQSGNNPDGTVSDNPGPGYYITGLENKDWDSTKIQHGRAATEDQLQQVAEDIKQGTVTGDKYITGGTATYTDNGSGSAALSGTNGLAGTISGLHDYYIKEGTVSDDGKTLTLTKNDDSKVTVNLDKVMKSDMRLVQNPARTDGRYTVDSNGNLNLTVQDANGTESTKQTITLSGLASKAEVDKGLNFAANSGTAYKAKLGDTVTIKGTAVKDGHDYSADNVTTEVDDNGNITIKLDKALTADTVMVNGKDGRDGQIGLNGKDGKDGTVTTIIRTIGKNGTDGKNGTAGVNGTDGITRIVYQDGKDGGPGTTTHTVATLDDGLKFGANVPAAGKTDNPVGNKLNSTINIKGAGTKTLDQYSGQNLITSVEQDADGNTTIHVLMDKALTADTVMVNGKDGKDGQIGLNGKNGTDGTVTTIIRTVGKNGTNGTDGKPGVNGTDGITRIIYQDGKDGESGTTTYTVATLDDGLKFAGDDGQTDTTKVISKKLNEQLDIIGGADLGSLTDNNIGVKNEEGKLYVRLAKHVDLDKDGSLKAGDLTIGAFSNTQLTTNKKNHALEGSYAVGLSNREWSVADPEYVSGRAATEDQLKVVSDAIHNRQLVNTDYQLVANPDPTTDGSYTATNGELTLTVRDTEHKDDPKYPDKTITIKDIASKTKVDEAYDRTVKYDMKDGKVDKTHVTFEAVDEAGNSVDTQVSHMASGASEIKMDEKGRPISYVYDIDNNGANIGDVKNIAKSLDEEVTKRGLDFRGNDGKTVHRDLGTLLNLTGGLKDQDELAQATGKNLGVRQNGDQDGLEIVMTDTPDFTKVTVGEGTDTNSKITIGNQTVTGKKSDGSTADQPQTGNYITGLDNKAWDKDNIVENRAATEGQLKDAIQQISGKAQGGFGLADETGNTVKQDLGGTIAVKGDGKNIQTKVKDGGLEISLNKDVDLGADGSVKAGDTTIDKDGVETNKVKVGGITITDQGINGGTKQITNMASGIDGKQYTDAGDNNAASIGDVKQLAKDEVKASEARSGKNITVKDDHTVNLNDDITLGNDSTKQVTVKGSEGQVTIGSGDKTLTLGQQANGTGDNNPPTGNFLNGLDNRKWDGEHIQNGRAATEDQLKTVSDKVDSGRIFQGDDGQDVTVGLGDTLKIQGGAREVSSDPNIGIVKGADDTLNVRLAKDLTGLNSVTTGGTTINNSGLTVKTGDSTHQDITIQQGDVNMGGNKIEGVAPGKISKDSTDAVNGSQLYAADQAISYLGGTVNKLGTRVDRVGAGSAALAALHPLDFDPDDKWDFAAGYGHYRGANAAAVGAYYRPNEDTMFSIGGSFGGGENMFNAGVSIKLGQGNHISTSRVAMAKEMEAMRRHMAEQDALIAKLESMHGMAEGPEKSVLFPDVAENHWAYQYVTTLAKKGLLEGYPDGEFKGERMMTRYEFAAIVYRIVESGVGSTDPELSKLVREFSPELQYIRIDTIHRDHNGQPTVQRVRVKDRK